MTLTEIQKEAQTLDNKGQKKLMGFLVSLQIRRDDEYRQELTEILDDKSPEKWLSFDEVENRLNEKQ